jgi:hypothetical protein
MEIRLKIAELIIVILCLFASGATLGITITGNLSVTSGFLYSAGMLLPSLTIIIRKRFKLRA